MYIEKVNSPADVKKLSVGELNELSGEIRRVLLNKLSTHGGHVGKVIVWSYVTKILVCHFCFET